jgi:hypothetical protein
LIGLVGAFVVGLTCGGEDPTDQGACEIIYESEDRELGSSETEPPEPRADGPSHCENATRRRCDAAILNSSTTSYVFHDGKDCAQLGYPYECPSGDWVAEKGDTDECVVQANVGGCQDGACLPILGDCIDIDEYATCDEMCATADETCAQAGCDGQTIWYYEANGLTCRDHLIPIESSAQACDDPVNRAMNADVAAARCCCTHTPAAAQG